MLQRSIYVLCLPVMLVFAMLACAGTPLNDTPVHVCPSPVPSGTLQPLYTPTPHLVTDGFYVGDRVTVGAVGAARRVSFRLYDVATITVGDANVYTWRLEVQNLGTLTYEVFPTYQLYLSEIATPQNILNGTWGATQTAGDAVGLTVDSGIYVLTAGASRIFDFAAFAPIGEAAAFTFTLDPSRTDSPVIRWRNTPNPECER